MQVDYTGVIQKADYTGLIRGSYVVRHRVTGEFCTVELGARYNQREWDIVGPISLLGDLLVCLNRQTSTTSMKR